MSKEFIQMTSGWIPVAVMALLTIALIAGQASANLPDQAERIPGIPGTGTIDSPTTNPTIGIIGTPTINGMPKRLIVPKIDSVAPILDTIRTLPIDFELHRELRGWTVDSAGIHAPSRPFGR